MADISQYEPFIQESSQKHSVRPTLLRQLILHESAGNSDAVGDNGLARGLCQMHPNACKTVGADWDDMFVPACAIDAGAAYLRWCYDHVNQDWTWALAAYNQGPTVIGRGWQYANEILSAEGDT